MLRTEVLSLVRNQLLILLRKGVLTLLRNEVLTFTGFSNQLMIIRKTIEASGPNEVFKAIEYCDEHSIYDATSLKAVVEKVVIPDDDHINQPEDLKLLVDVESLKKASIKPIKSNIDNYENLFSN